MKYPLNAFTKAIEGLLRSKAKSATVYLNDRYRVTATWTHKSDSRPGARHCTLAVTFGVLNYAGREFVRACKAAGEPFPVRKVQLKAWPIPRPKKKKRAARVRRRR